MKPNTKRPRGRPRKRWVDGTMNEDLKILGIKNTGETAKDREEWRLYTFLEPMGLKSM